MNVYRISVRGANAVEVFGSRAFYYNEYWTPEYPPSGCGHCGIARHDHFRRFSGGVGWHKFQPPTQEAIKQRMLARRADAQARIRARRTRP